jgi:hypothetical protein
MQAQRVRVKFLSCQRAVFSLLEILAPFRKSAASTSSYRNTHKIMAACISDWYHATAVTTLSRGWPEFFAFLTTEQSGGSK